MNENQNLSEKLGFSKDSKLLIIHADDAGLSCAENKATIESLQNGSVNSYSIMVNCPWFYQIAQFAKENPMYDYGIHLTLTCEWQSFKFGPVLSINEVPSLVDKNGFFYKSRKELLEHADLKEVKLELCAQIEKAFHLGLIPTHLDSHMYSLGVSNDYLNIYHELGETYNLPIMLNKNLIKEISGLDQFIISTTKNALVDHVILGNYEAFKKGILSGFYEESLENMKKGFNLILIHPAYNSSEMKTITVNHPNFGSEWRQIDLDFFTSKKCKDIIAKNDIQLITWKDIKNLYYS